MATPSITIASKGLLSPGTTVTLTIAVEGLLYTDGGGGGGGSGDSDLWITLYRRRGRR